MSCCYWLIYLSHLTSMPGPVCSSKSWIGTVLATYWEIHTQSAYICPSIAPSHLIFVIIQQKQRPKQWGAPNERLALSRSKNSLARDVINGILPLANQGVFSCHVTANFGPARWWSVISAKQGGGNDHEEIWHFPTSRFLHKYALNMG